jgi:hypothetical protein
MRELAPMRARPRVDEESGFVANTMHDTPEEAAYRAQMAAYFEAVINHGDAGDILRNLERAVERLAFVRACIIPFTLNADGDLHQDAYHPLEVISNELNYIGFAPPLAEEADEAAA